MLQKRNSAKFEWVSMEEPTSLRLSTAKKVAEPPPTITKSFPVALVPLLKSFGDLLLFSLRV
jgi:hypothetical protein